MSDNKQKKSKGFPTKRDFWYSFSIAVLILIFMGAHLFKNDGLLADKLEFAATVVSIILAVIAIVMTLTEGYKNARANEQILESSDKIKESTEILGILTKDIKNISYLSDQIELIKANTEFINDTISLMNEQVVTKQDIKEIPSEISNIVLKDQLRDSNSSGENYIERVEEIINFLRPNLKFAYKVSLYSLLKVHENNLNTGYIWNILVYTLKDSHGVSMIWAYLFLMQDYGLFNFKENKNDDNATIIEISKSFENFINELVAKEHNIKEHVDSFLGNMSV